MIVAVTGADGLLGSNIVRALMAAGHTARVLIQPGRQSTTLQGLPIQQMRGDILDPQALRELCSDADMAIHAAAATAVWPARSAVVQRVNVEGTRNVIQAALHCHLQRLVHIGTANSFGPGSKTDPGDESRPYAGGSYGLDYMDSKHAAQQLVLAAVAQHGLPALTVNPTFMIGPYDATPSSGRMVLRLAAGQVPGFSPGGRCWVHAGDVAVATVNALERGTIGTSYIAGNENLSYAEFFALAAETLGVQPPARYLPKAAVLLTGVAGSIWGGLSGRPPLLSLPMAKIACDDHYYCVEKARSELGLPATPITTAVRQCFDWLAENGYVNSNRERVDG